MGPSVLLALLLAVAPEGGEAPTRAEEWAALRRAKAERPPEPPRSTWLERQMLALEQRRRPGLFELNLYGLYPRLQAIAAGSEMAGGVRLWRPDLGPTRLDLHGSAFYSVRAYEFYDLQLGLLPHRGPQFPPRSTRDDDVYELGDVRRPFDRLVAYASVRHRDEPRTPFFGLGGHTPEESETHFRFRDTQTEAVLGWQWSSSVVTTVRGGLRWPRTRPGPDDDEDPSIEQLFDDAAAPGLSAQPAFVTLGAFALADRRDEPGNPRRGGMAAVGVTRFADREDGRFDFTRVAVDARGYLPLASTQRVLALRAYVSRDHADDGARVPFHLQESLGGGRVLRGFHTFRFRGEKVLALQAEYRWEAWPALEMAVFGDAGRAFRGDESLALDDLERSWGVGVRLKAHDRVLGRMEVAFGDEGTIFRVRLGPSF